MIKTVLIIWTSLATTTILHATQIERRPAEQKVLSLCELVANSGEYDGQTARVKVLFTITQEFGGVFSDDSCSPSPTTGQGVLAAPEFPERVKGKESKGERQLLTLA